MKSHELTSPMARALRAQIEWLPERLRVFVPSATCAVLVIAAFCLSLILRNFSVSWELVYFFCSVLAGPFAGIWMMPQDRVTAIVLGIVNLGGMLTHPLWPNLATSIITYIAFAIWLFFGLAFTCVNV